MLTFSYRCAPTHPPVSPLARTRRWRWRVSRLPWLHPPEEKDEVLNVSERVTPPTQICPSPGNWMMPSSLFRCSLWLMGRTLGTVLLWDTWHVWHVTWWPRWCCPRPCRSCPPSPRTSPTRWRTWRGTPHCRGCKSKSALKWEYTENLFFWHFNNAIWLWVVKVEVLEWSQTNYDQRSSDSNFELPRYHRGAIYQT